MQSIYDYCRNIDPSPAINGNHKVDVGIKYPKGWLLSQMIYWLGDEPLELSISYIRRETDEIKEGFVLAIIPFTWYENEILDSLREWDYP
ncbi:MAG: hypothetical protein JSW41_04815 [Candidatus Aenigmatarchaeota archaeon]|nr:MAG: hypothetical protein JSW41_04815 [Candidatus Aenigmarchaeota archaeon]